MSDKLLRQTPKPKFGCFSIAAPVAVVIALLTWLVIA